MTNENEQGRENKEGLARLVEAIKKANPATLKIKNVGNGHCAYSGVCGHAYSVYINGYSICVHCVSRGGEKFGYSASIYKSGSRKGPIKKEYDEAKPLFDSIEQKYHERLSLEDKKEKRLQKLKEEKAVSKLLGGIK